MHSTNKPDFISAWTEPISAANTTHQPVYPYNDVKQTRSGHSLEFDDTPTRERIRLQHRSQTFMEIHPTGDQVTKVYGDDYEIVIKDKNIEIKGKLNIKVHGDANFWIQGDKIEQVEGNVEQRIKGNFTQVVEGLTSISSMGDATISAGAGYTGALTLVTPGSINAYAGAVSVSGELTAQKITSEGRIDTGPLSGLSVGLQGITTTGGIAVGTVLPIPKMITCVGPIYSLTSMSAPLGSFGISSSILAFDIINTMLRRVHTHPAPKGITGPPISKEMTA